jgi:hypothetical protein
MKFTLTGWATVALALAAAGTVWAHGMGSHERMPMGHRMDLGSHMGMGMMGMHAMGRSQEPGGCMQHGAEDGARHRHDGDAAPKAPSAKPAPAPAQDAAKP